MTNSLPLAAVSEYAALECAFLKLIAFEKANKMAELFEHMLFARNDQFNARKLMPVQNNFLRHKTYF